MLVFYFFYQINMNKIVLFIITMLWLLNIVYADNVNIIWQTNYQINDVSSELKDMNTLYWVNLDIIILWQDEKWCFKEKNYIKCAKDNYWLMGSFIWSINLWIKETTGKWDVNSWMSSSMDNTREIINEQDMKFFQEDNLSYLKNWDYNGAIIWFISSFKNQLTSTCDTYSKRWLVVGIKITDCKINNLDKQIDEIINKEAVAKQEADFKLQKEKQIEVDKLKDKTTSFFISLFILFIIGGILYAIYKAIYNSHIKNNYRKLFWDLLEYKKFIENQDNLLEKDKEIILSELSNLLKDSEISLWNRVISSDDLEKISKIKTNIENKVANKIIDKDLIKDVNNDIEEVKKMDL